MKKKIAVIGLKGLPAFGGAAAVGENIIEQLKDKYEFTVYATSSHTDLKSGNYGGYEQIVFKRIPLKILKMNIIYYYLLSTLHSIFMKNYDLIYLHHSITGFIIPLLKLKYKVILTMHSTKIRENFEKYKLLFIFLEKIALKYSDLVTLVAQSKFNELKYFHAKKIIYIPNGTNINELNNTNGEKKYGNYLMFAAGRILPSKGCHILLDALNIIHYREKVVIAGNLNILSDYKKKIIDASKHLNLKFLGLIKDKRKLFQIIKDSKYFIFPSTIEAMSIMLLEVASLKVSIICSDIKENKDIFNNREVLFFKSSNPFDLAQKILWAEKHNEEMKLMADRAHNKVVKQYNWKIISEQYDRCFNSLLNFEP